MSGVSSIIHTIEPNLVDYMKLELGHIWKSDDAKIDSFWLLILLIHVVFYFFDRFAFGF